MPRQLAKRQLLNFVGGLQTESSPLSFPENTAKDLDNVDLDRDGSIRRRRGIDYETGYVLSAAEFTDADLQTAALSDHEWTSVEGDDTLNFHVHQCGGTLYFHDLGSEIISENALGYLDISPLRAREDFEKYTISSTTGKGKLFITSPAISPAYIEYDKDSGEFTGVKLTLKIRDIDGIEEDDDAPIVFDNDVTPDTPLDPEEDNDDVIEDVDEIVIPYIPY